MDTISKIRELIAENELQEAVQELKKLETTSKIRNEISELSARLFEIKALTNKGVLSDQLILLEKNKIRSALLEILARIGENNDLQKNTPVTKSIKIVVALASIIITGLILFEIISNDSSNKVEKGVSVYVQLQYIDGPESKKSFYIDTLFLGNEHLVFAAIVDKKGQASFTIPSIHSGDIFLLSWKNTKDFALRHPEQEYLIVKEDTVHISIVKKVEVAPISVHPEPLEKEPLEANTYTLLLRLADASFGLPAIYIDGNFNSYFTGILEIIHLPSEGKTRVIEFRYDSSYTYWKEINEVNLSEDSILINQTQMKFKKL